MSYSTLTVKFASNWVKFEDEEGMDMRGRSTYVKKPGFFKKPGFWGGLLLGGTIAIASPTTLAKSVPPTAVKRDYPEAARRRGDIDGYLVYVDRYSRNLLEAVQRVERSATRVRFKGRDVIQLAIYRRRSTAEDRLRDLESRGIIADIATVDTRRYARQFFVYVISSDPRILREVRELTDSAFFVRYRGRTVIRAGIFDSEDRALRLANRLRDRRLIPRVDLVEFEESWARFEAVGDDRPVASVDNDYYAVVIPCSEEELPVVEAQVRQMAPDFGSQEGISRRNEADGSYVMVGPFRNRETAENWHRYLQDFGMENAQIYYSR
ncbi:hypothetical protein [Microseira wollei]|uniref:SPOR domain-containing protein n=1 Tax=Microseira wollei NIES-4236 TaxID=2530354 RepID=A0AAV3XAN1_9CYAN|nr:hypothetical protein [Microseira wollei]GET38458.1 hypothetical protein MiSe_32160 [Microseira wollei NIES-4236]